ncbi:zinc-binding dehydrogenase [Paenibacillus sp. P26]|nr:zinc-binding dehydrogenase [Paenibacillus sp. P26]
MKSVAADGHISQVGWLASESSSISIGAIASNVFTLKRIALGSRAHFEAMNRAIAASRLRPVIDRVFSFEEAGEALSYFKDNSRFGKVVIRMEQGRA